MQCINNTKLSSHEENPLPARSRRRDDSTQLLRVRDGYHYIGLSRSGGDGAILAKAKIEIPQRSTDVICGADAKNRHAEIIFEDISCPVSRKYPRRDGIVTISDTPRHRSSVVAGESRIGPFDSFLGDCGIAKREGCIPSSSWAVGSTRIAKMRREYFRHIGIFDVEVASARCGVTRLVEDCHREVDQSIPMSGRSEER